MKPELKRALQIQEAVRKVDQARADLNIAQFNLKKITNYFASAAQGTAEQAEATMQSQINWADTFLAGYYTQR